MSIISLQNIEKSFGSISVFCGLNVSFHKGQRVGLVGPNGCGKTTLLKLIIGSETPDKGIIYIQKNLKIAYLPQETLFPPERKDQTVFDMAAEGLEEIRSLTCQIEEVVCGLETDKQDVLRLGLSKYEHIHRLLDQKRGWNPDSSIKSVLCGLGLSEDTHFRPVSTLSGGQLSRLILARTLVQPSDVLLLDEPTNHLDLQGIEWLETFLKNYKGTILLISHDRYFLNQLSDHIVEIEDGKAVFYKGNYTSFLEQKKIRRLSEERILRRRKEFIAKTLDFIARNKDQEGMRRTARGRKTRLRRLLHNNPEFLKSLPKEKRIFFRFGTYSGQGEKMISGISLSKRYGTNILFQDLNIELERGDRIVVIGPNGSGKTTLLKILLGLDNSDTGTVQRRENLRIGYLDQHAQTLSVGKSVLEEAASVRPDLTQENLRSRLAAFLFRGEQVFQKTETLSGGQKSRLMLAKLVLAEPDVLLLDEPTNHLDIESCQALEEALDLYEGTVLAVSHDRTSLISLFEKMLILGRDKNGRTIQSAHSWYQKLSDEKGIFTQWTELIASQCEKTAAEKKETSKKEISVKSAPTVLSTPPELRPFNAWTIETIEEKILSLEEEIESLTLQYGKEDTYRNKDSFKTLQENLDKKKSELALLYRAYDWRTSKKNR